MYMHTRILGYDMSCFEEFKTGLVDQHSLINVEEVLWKTYKRGNNAKSLILSFRSDIPTFIDISGETATKKAFELSTSSDRSSA